MMTSRKYNLESDIHLSFASVNTTVLVLTNPDGNLKIVHQLYNVVCTRCMLNIYCSENLQYLHTQFIICYLIFLSFGTMGFIVEL